MNSGIIKNMPRKLFKKIYHKRLPFKSRIAWFNEVRYVYALSALVLSAAFFLSLWFAYGYFSANRSGNSLVEPHKNTQNSTNDCVKINPLSGRCLADEEESVQPVAVMIDNHMRARPQSGLARASIVYEAPVEGNFTRFMAIYALETRVEKVGPVRSARPYFLNWLLEYGRPLYMHVGGSPQALEQIEFYNIFDFNEFYRGWYFWRDQQRAAPHNVYTNDRLWKKGFEKYAQEAGSSRFSGWHYGQVECCERDCVLHVKLEYGPGYFEPSWWYNTSTGKFVRHENGEQYFDSDGTPVLADNVIVQRVRTAVIDELGRLRISTVGQGDAYIFTRGNILEGRWQKEEQKKTTQWLSTEGRPIELTPGITWVQILGQDGKMNIEYF